MIFMAHPSARLRGSKCIVLLAMRLRGCQFNPIPQIHLGEGGSTVLYPGSLSYLGLGDYLITLDTIWDLPGYYLECYFDTLWVIFNHLILETFNCNYLFVKWGFILLGKE